MLVGAHIHKNKKIYFMRMGSSIIYLVCEAGSTATSKRWSLIIQEWDN